VVESLWAEMRRLFKEIIMKIEIEQTVQERLKLTTQEIQEWYDEYCSEYGSLGDAIYSIKVLPDNPTGKAEGCCDWNRRSNRAIITLYACADSKKIHLKTTLWHELCHAQDYHDGIFYGYRLIEGNCLERHLQPLELRALMASARINPADAWLLEQVLCHLRTGKSGYSDREYSIRYW